MVLYKLDELPPFPFDDSSDSDSEEKVNIKKNKPPPRVIAPPVEFVISRGQKHLPNRSKPKIGQNNWNNEQQKTDDKPDEKIVNQKQEVTERPELEGFLKYVGDYKRKVEEHRGILCKRCSEN